MSEKRCLFCKFSEWMCTCEYRKDAIRKLSYKYADTKFYGSTSDFLLDVFSAMTKEDAKKLLEAKS